MKKVYYLLLGLASLVISSCKTIVYKYPINNLVDGYVLQNGEKFEHFLPSIKYDQINRIYDPSDLDTLLDNFLFASSSEISYNFSVRLDSNSLYFNYELNKKQIKDTLKLDHHFLQFNKLAPFSSEFFDVASFSNQFKNLCLYKGKFDVRYAKDTVCFFANQLPIRVHLFDFYPNKGNYQNSSKIDTLNYNYPIRVGLSSQNGALICMNYFQMHFGENSKFWENSIFCIDYKIHRGSRRNLKRVLM